MNPQKMYNTIEEIFKEIEKQFSKELPFIYGDKVPTEISKDLIIKCLTILKNESSPLVVNAKKATAQGTDPGLDRSLKEAMGITDFTLLASGATAVLEKVGVLQILKKPIYKKNHAELIRSSFTDSLWEKLASRNLDSEILSEENAQWYRAANDWISQLNKKSILKEGWSWMANNGKAIVCCFDEKTKSLIPEKQDINFEGSLYYLDAIAFDKELKNIRNITLTFQAESGNYTPDKPGFSQGEKYFIYEPYTPFGNAINKTQIVKTINMISETAKKLAQADHQIAETTTINDIADLMTNQDLPLLILQGPPGTGKTYALAAFVKKMVKSGFGGRIYCLAHTHRAVEEISEKLKNLEVKHFIRKLGKDIPVECDETMKDCFPHCRTIFSFPRKLTTRDILFIDEVSQITLAPLINVIRNAKMVRLFGDHKQLQPIIPIIERPDKVTTELSTLSDLEKPDYKVFGFSSEEDLFNMNNIQKLILDMINHPFSLSLISLDEDLPSTPDEIKNNIKNIRFMLKESFRMRPEIMSFPNKQWYASNLQPQKPGETLNIKDSKLSDFVLKTSLENNAVIFIRYKFDKVFKNSNKIELDIIEKIMEHLNFYTTPHQIGCVVPFRAQETLLKRDKKISIKGHISTVERFQGRDLDRAIVSLTTNSKQYFINESRVFTENKYNVAITRSKQQLIVIGSEEYFNRGLIEDISKEKDNPIVAKYPLMYLTAIYEHYKHSEKEPNSKILEYMPEEKNFREYTERGNYDVK